MARRAWVICRTSTSTSTSGSTSAASDGEGDGEEAQHGEDDGDAGEDQHDDEDQGDGGAGLPAGAPLPRRMRGSDELAPTTIQQGRGEATPGLQRIRAVARRGRPRAGRLPVPRCRSAGGPRARPRGRSRAERCRAGREASAPPRAGRRPPWARLRCCLRSKAVPPCLHGSAVAMEGGATLVRGSAVPVNAEQATAGRVSGEPANDGSKAAAAGSSPPASSTWEGSSSCAQDPRDSRPRCCSAARCPEAAARRSQPARRLSAECGWASPPASRVCCWLAVPPSSSPPR